MGGVDAFLVLVAAEESHTLNVVARLISSVESHIKELLVHSLGPEYLRCWFREVAWSLPRVVDIFR